MPHTSKLARCCLSGAQPICFSTLVPAERLLEAQRWSSCLSGSLTALSQEDVLVKASLLCNLDQLNGTSKHTVLVHGHCQRHVTGSHMHSYTAHACPRMSL